MPPLRPLSFREVERKLAAAGLLPVSQKGSHVKFVKWSEEGTRTAVVPRYREVQVGTLRSVLRQAGITVGEFEQL